MYINSTNNAQNPLSPTQLNQSLTKLLKSELNSFWLSGEISDYYQSHAGHNYFSLKDSDASIRCVLFKQQGDMKFKNGHQIIVIGYLSMYAPRGAIQINVLKALDAGSGLLQQKFLQLKQKLSLSGLFDASRKKTLPGIIEDVGIITSPNGAAIKDVLEVIKRKNPLINMTLYPTSVQGHTAVNDILKALARADSAQHQILLLTRGGGSQEDLWYFNDERLARQIAQLETPLLTAIGHERDISIADLTADEVAITPTAAGERLSGDFFEKTHALKNQSAYLELLIKNNVRKNQQSIDGLMHRIQKQHPKTRLSHQHHQLDQLKHVLTRTISLKREATKSEINHLQNKLHSLRPNTTQLKSNLKQSTQLMSHLLKNTQQQRLQQFQGLISTLDSLSPLSVLTRGYSYTTTMDGQVVKSAIQLKSNEMIETQLKSGKIHSKIVERFDK